MSHGGRSHQIDPFDVAGVGGPDVKGCTVPDFFRDLVDVRPRGRHIRWPVDLHTEFITGARRSSAACCDAAIRQHDRHRVIAVWHALRFRKGPGICRGVKDFGPEQPQARIFADYTAIANEDRPIWQNHRIDMHPGDTQ